MVRLAEERRPKDTVFQLGPKKWTMQEIKRKREKGIDDIEFGSSSLVVVVDPADPVSQIRLHFHLNLSFVHPP